VRYAHDGDMMSSSDLTEEMPAGALPLTALRTERPAPDPAKVAELDENAARFEAQKRWQDLIKTLLAKADLLVEPGERIALYERVAGLYIERFANQAEAIKAYEHVVEIDPSHSRAVEFLKGGYERRREWDKLLPLLKREAASVPEERQLEHYLTLARFVSEKVKKPEASMEMWEEVLRRDPGNSEALAQLGGLYERQKDFAKLAYVLREQAAQTPDPAARIALLVKLGMIAGDKLNDDALAVEAWRGVLALDPNDRRAQEALKKRYLAMHAWDELETFYAESGKWDELIRVLEREAEQPGCTSETKISLYSKIAQLWAERKEKFDRAAKYLEKILELDPTHRDAALRLIPIYHAANQARPLAGVLEVKAAGDDLAERVETLRELGALYEGPLKDPNKAYERYQEAFQLDPVTPRSVEDLERAAEGAGRWNDAVAVLAKALDEPLVPSAVIRLQLHLAAALATRLARVDDAVARYREVLELDPANLDALTAQEALLRGASRWSELLAVLERRLGLASKPEERRTILYDIERLQENELHDPEHAVSTCLAIVAEFGDESEVLAALDRLYQKLERWPELVDVLERELARCQAEGAEDAAAEVKFRLGRALETYLGRARDAIAHYREILALMPEHEGARLALEALLRDPDLRGEAARILDPIYELRADWEALIRSQEILLSEETDVAARVALLVRIGDVCAEKIGSPQRAFEAYGRALREDPHNTAVRTTLTALAGQTGAWTELVALLREVADGADPALARTLWLLIAEMEFRQVGSIERAVAAYERVLEQNPADAEALEAIEQTYRAAGRWQDVLSVYRRRLDLVSDPDARDEIQAAIAEVYEEKLGDPETAVKTWRDVLDVDPANRRALESLDRLFTRLGRWSDLSDNLLTRLALAESPDEQTALQLRLASLREERMGDVAGAIDIYRQILERDIANADAIGALEQLIELPEHAQTIADILEPVYRELGTYDRLAYAYEVLARNATDKAHKVELLHRIAEIQETALDQPDHAFATYTRALGELPGNQETIDQLDRLSRVLRRHEDFVAVLEQYIAATDDPAAQVALHTRAASVAEERLTIIPSAIEHQEAILKIDPQNLQAATALERLYQSMEKPAELAGVYLRKAEIVDDPEERKQYLLRAADIYEAVLERPAEAIAAFRRIVEIDPQDVPALDALIRLYITHQQWDDLLDVYVRKVELVGEPEEKKQIFFDMATVYEGQLGNPSAAIDTYNKVLELDPADVTAIGRLDVLYQAQGRWRDLLGILEREADLAADPSEVVEFRYRAAKLHEERLENTGRAVEIYRDILEVAPDHEPTLTALTNILHGDKEPLAAAAVLEPVLTTALAYDRLVDVLEVQLAHAVEPARRVELLHRIADIQEQVLERPAAALDAFARAVPAEPLNEHTLAHFERLAEALGQWPLVAQTYDRAVAELNEQPNERLELLLRAAAIYEVHLGDAESAIARYRQALEIDPQSSPALRSLDRLYEGLERWPELAEVLRREVALSELSPDETLSVRHRLAQVLEHRLHDVEGALAVYREILDVQADHPGAVTDLESMFARGVKREETFALLEPIYRMGEQWEKLADIQARSLEFVSDPTARLQVMHAIAELVEEKLGDAVGAFGWYARALREHPLDERSLVEVERLAAVTDGWADLTNVYADIVEAEGATTEVKRAIGKKLARVHEEELQDIQSAEGAYNFVLDVEPLDPEALEALDRLYTASADAARLAPILDRRAQATQETEAKVEFTYRLAQILQDPLGQVEEAVARYRSIVEELDAHHAPSLDALEAIYLQGERWQELYDVYQRKLDLATSDDEQAEIYSRMARLADQYLGRSGDAVGLFEKVLALRGEDVETLAALANLHDAAGRYHELIEVLERQLAAEPDHEQRVIIALRIPAVYLHHLRDVERAIEGYRRVLDIEPNSFDALRALADIYRAQQAWELLVETDQTLIQLGAAVLPTEEIKAAYTELGTIYWNTLGQPWEAVDAWNHVIEIDPTDTTAIEALLTIYTAQGEWREVVSVLQKKADAQEDGAAKVPIYLQMAGVWEQQIEEPDGARGAYEKILEIEPLHEHAFRALEALHQTHGRWDDLAALYVARHDTLAEAGDVKQAVPYMRAAAMLYDEKLGDREQAFAAAQIAFDEDVTDRETVSVLERLAGSTGKWNELLKNTLDEYQKAPAGQRKTAMGLHVARWYGTELGHPEWAVPIYQQILAAEPGNLQALHDLATLYRRQGQWANIPKILQRCVDASRTDEDRRRFHIELGEVLEKHLNQPEQAVEHYNAALALNPRDRAALAALARVYEARGDARALVDVQRRRIDAAEDAAEAIGLRLEVGRTLEERVGDLEGAVSEYRAVLESDPGNLDALRGLERLYLRQENAPALLQVLEAQLDYVPTERERIKLLSRIGAMQEEQFVKPDLAIERFEQVLEIDPSDAGALNALERLYRHTGRWNELIHTLERHLAATPDRRERVPLYEQMGRVYLDELRDYDHAEDAFRNVLEIDPQHLGALEALGRVYEAKGDWDNAVVTMEQLGDLLGHDRARQVDLRYRIAKIVETRLEDEFRAMEMFRSALDVDPNHLKSLEALRTIAARREEWYDAARYLEREQAVTEQPLTKARLLAELGRIHAQHLDDADRAVAWYEEAIRYDPDLEEAAWPLAMHYVAHERWAEAEPLMEMLVRRAARRDPLDQFQIQVTMGRVAQALGKLDRAVKAFSAAHNLDRANVEAIRLLANAHYEKRDWENAFKHYQLLLVHHKDELDAEGRADLYHRLGVVKREQGDRRRAANFLEKALEEVPGYRPAIEAMIETYIGAGEWEQVIAYKNMLLENEFEDAKRLPMIVEIGDLWQDKVKNPHKAIQSYVAALEIKPGDRPLLHKLMVLYQETGQWSKLVEVIAQLMEQEQKPEVKARYAYTIASIYNDRLKDPDQALTYYNLSLDANPTELKPFAKINEILTARRDFKNLERNFRKMLHRIAGKNEKDLEFNLLHNLGIIYRDRLAQPDAALKAFAMAADRKPEDLTEQKILAELYAREGKTDEAVAHWRKIAQATLATGEINAEALNAIYDLFYGSRQYDKAWCVAATATFLLGNAAREEARAFYEQYKPRRPLAPTGRLTEEHWLKLLFHPEEDPVTSKIFAAVLGPLRKAKTRPVAQFGFTQKEQQDPATSSVALVKALASSANALSLPMPWIFVRPSQPGGLGYVPSEPIASFAGSGLLSGLTPQELAFVAAKHMAYYRNEHYVRVLFPTTQELTAIMLAAIKLVKPDQELPPEAQQTAQQLAPLVAQDPIAAEGLRKVVRYFLDQGGSSNIKRWYQTVELTAARAGFLLCGDLEIAKKMLALEPGLPGDVSPSEKLKDVILFSISDSYFALREALGINFQSAAAY
jgi:tetratricopeptide (TPR) repeat protein